MNPLSIIKYQLYLLQLENYELVRYWRLLRFKGYFGSRDSLRKELQWSYKIILILTLSIIIIFIASFYLFYLNYIYFALYLIFSLLLLPAYFSISLILIWPFDFLIKKIIFVRANKFVKKIKNLKIIGVAGSYGKTTMKNVLATILSEQYSVLSSPGNINTAAGLSLWMMKNFKNDFEFLIIELGEEYKGDNKRICQIFPLDFVIITGINEAHLERMKTIKNVAETIFESAVYAKNDAKILLNADDINIVKYYREYCGVEKSEFFGQSNSKFSSIVFTDKKFDSKELSWIANNKTYGQLSVKVLGEYIFSQISAALLVTQHLKIDKDKIVNAISKIEPVEHRLQPIQSSNGILVIDDSYNGNPDGVREAINTLKNFKNRRKLYITPGLVETANQSKQIHLNIGKQLSSVADKVILIKNSVTPHIADGLKAGGFSNNNIIWFDSATEAHESLGQILQPNDVILFQNDWGDQYL